MSRDRNFLPRETIQLNRKSQAALGSLTLTQVLFNIIYFKLSCLSHQGDNKFPRQNNPVTREYFILGSERLMCVTGFKVIHSVMKYHRDGNVLVVVFFFRNLWATSFAIGRKSFDFPTPTDATQTLTLFPPPPLKFTIVSWVAGYAKCVPISDIGYIWLYRLYRLYYI